LLRSHAQVADLGLGPDVGMIEQRENIGDQFAVLAAADDTGPNVFLTEHHVGLDSQIGSESQLLINHRDASRPCLARASWRVAFTGQAHRSRVGPICPGEDLHERALTGSVLANERAYLT
jgi:hypothetical protein